MVSPGDLRASESFVRAIRPGREAVSFKPARRDTASRNVAPCDAAARERVSMFAREGIFGRRARV